MPAPASRRARWCRAPSPTSRDSARCCRGAARAPRAAARPHAMRRCPRRTREWKSATPAEHGFEPRRERAGAERLGEKIVGAELEDANFIDLVALCGQHDDGNVRGGGPRAQMREHAVAMEPRKGQVEHDDVPPDPIDLIEGLHAVTRLGPGAAVALT